jgi:hypothetical protein
MMTGNFTYANTTMNLSLTLLLIVHSTHDQANTIFLNLEQLKNFNKMPIRRNVIGGVEIVRDGI